MIQGSDISPIYNAIKRIGSQEAFADFFNYYFRNDTRLLPAPEQPTPTAAAAAAAAAPKPWPRAAARARAARSFECFKSLCIRDNDLVCERLCYRWFGDAEAKVEIDRQEREWLEQKLIQQQQIRRKVEEMVEIVRKYVWQELYAILAKLFG